MNKKIIPIFFASDKNYVPYLTVAIKSIAKFASKAYCYKIYILSNDLSAKDISEINAIQTNNFIVSIVDVNKKIESIKNKVALRDYYSISIYFRLFIPTLFPEYEKAVYLDSDIVLNNDVAKLYNVDIKNNLVGAVLDETVFTNKSFCYYVNEALDVTEKQYFNSGVLVMNLKKFRELNIEDDFYNWVNKYCLKFGSVAPDQDYLNCVCKNKVKYLSLGWDKMPLGEKWKDEDVNLIHYNMFMKPWKYTNVLYEEYFWEIAKQTSYYYELQQCLQSYSSEQKALDKLKTENLIKLAVNIANSKNNYKCLVLKKDKEIQKSVLLQSVLEDIEYQDEKMLNNNVISEQKN